MNLESGKISLNRPEKIKSFHLDRLAVIYIRQSTIQQLERNQESTRRQYSLTDRALQLGWPKERVEIIDEDLGKSGASIENRSGFQRLAGEVGLNKVGIILGLEISRLARSCKDWYYLLEMCGIFGTLIGDSDGIYNPVEYNDRLLLGLKGTMSEAELHIIKQRMVEGKRTKAKRGELGMQVAMGFVRKPSGETTKDPDAQAQEVIELVFELFEKYRTINGVLQYLVKNKIKMPHRNRFGLDKGELNWRRSNRVTLSNMLHNPIYTGAYVYGRRPIDPKRKIAGRPATGRVVTQMDKWEVIIKNKFPGYISWEQFEKNIKQLEMNTSQGKGSPRRGQSLLSGLLICGKCGYRMATQYSTNGGGLRYACCRDMVNYGGQLCQSIKGDSLDFFVTKVIFKALEPASLELNLKAIQEIEKERKRLDNIWKQRLERAAYEVKRCFRQYNAVDPENRLVARNLETSWEKALSEEEKLKKEYEKFLETQPASLSKEEIESISRLSFNVPEIWAAPSTTSIDKQIIIRQLIEKIIVTVKDDSEIVEMEFFWAGGYKTKETMVRPVAKLDQLSYYSILEKCVKENYRKGKNVKEIADILNTKGLKPPKRSEKFSSGMVQSLLCRFGLTCLKRKSNIKEIDINKNECTVSELSYKLDIPRATIHQWIIKDILKYRKVTLKKKEIFLISAGKRELSRLKGLRIKRKEWSRHIKI